METTTQTPAGRGAGIDAEGVSLVGPDGLLQRVTKLVVENSLEVA